MDKIKVLQFPMANAYGGITQYALQNWRYIDKRRFQFDFATLSKTKLYFEDEVAAQNCKVYYISCYAEENEEQFKREMRAILSNGYDAVHLHTSYWKSFIVEELAREAGIPKIIIHAHNTSVLEGNNRKERIAYHNLYLAKLNESLATDYWACSWDAAKWLYGDSIPKKRIIIQKNAIDLEKYVYSLEIAHKIREELGWQNQYIIGHVGRFTYQKNQEFLVRVFRTVYDKNPNTRLLLVGVGSEREKIENLISNWNLSDAVHILEQRNDVHYLMQAFDCFALPSLFEGLPIVLIEAQAAGCDCLASDAVTKEAFLTDSVSKLPLDEEKWSDTLLYLATEKRPRNEKNVRVIRNQGYDIKKQIINIEEGYSK